MAVALTELKGRPLGTQKVMIERGPIRVFAQALMDDDPVYTGDAAPVPPTFPFVMPYWGSMGVGGAAGLPIENLRGKGRAILHGEQEFIYHGGDWPHAGDVHVGEGVISDVYEKAKSDGGKLEFYVTETTWSNERTSKPVVTTKFTLAINCKADAAEPKPLASCFTEDAEVDYSSNPGGKVGPYREVRGWLEKVLSAFPVTQHLMANIDV